MNCEKILIVEDDRDISTLLSDYTRASGYAPVMARNGTEALRLLGSEKPDLAIIDIMLPGMDGFEVCRKMRLISSLPIIFLSAKKDDADKILGLGIGADDYVTKPFSPRELMARVASHLRRYRDTSPASSGAPQCLRVCGLEINPESYSVTVRGREVPFSVKEFEILYFLASNINMALSREKIFNRVWGFSEYGDINTVTVHVRKIREKIEVDPSTPRYIETVWGIGYRFKAPEAI